MRIVSKALGNKSLSRGQVEQNRAISLFISLFLNAKDGARHARNHAECA